VVLLDIFNTLDGLAAAAQLLKAMLAGHHSHLVSDSGALDNCKPSAWA
jgi:hypothetical protein